MHILDAIKALKGALGQAKEDLANEAVAHLATMEERDQAQTDLKVGLAELAAVASELGLDYPAVEYPAKEPEAEAPEGE